MCRYSQLCVSMVATYIRIRTFSGHSCKYPGCKNVLVIDSNMKNQRDVCAATEAGFVEFEGLPGAIKTGCQLSTGYQSRYCYHYAPRVSTIQGEQSSHSISGTLQGEQSGHSEGVVKLITAQKQTRSGTYYQVTSSNEKMLPYILF